MKIKIMIIFILTIILIGGLCLSIIIEQNKVGEFDLSNYQETINKYPYNKVLGKITDVKMAKVKAIETFREKFGDDISVREKDYRVYFDENTQTWLVEGVLSSNWIKKYLFDYNLTGGTPGVIMQKEDGKVLTVWHGQ
jgi:hypothetical protein